MCQQSPARRIGQVPCLLLDLILRDAFEWRELHNLLPSEALEQRPRWRFADRDDRHVFARAHALCHQSHPVSRLLSRRLDATYREAMGNVARSSMSVLAGMCEALDLTRASDFAAFCWALHRDERRPVQQLLHAVASHVELLFVERFAQAHPDESKRGTIAQALRA